MKCWICGDLNANTREHMVKAGDLRSQCSPIQESPIYMQTLKSYQSTDTKIEKIVKYNIGSVESDKLKFEHYICQKCNSATTQPHDRGWECFSNQLLLHAPKLPLNQTVRFNQIIPYNTKAIIKNMHLYFVKLFGCQIVDNGMAIDLASFSDAIVNDKPHPNLYLSFGRFKNYSTNTLAANSEISAELLNNKVAFANWFYQKQELAVMVIYAEPNENRVGLTNAWHPRKGYKRFTFSLYGS